MSTGGMPTCGEFLAGEDRLPTRSECATLLHDRAELRPVVPVAGRPWLLPVLSATERSPAADTATDIDRLPCELAEGRIPMQLRSPW